VWREGSAVGWLRQRFLRAYDRSAPWPIELAGGALHEAATLGIRAMSYVWGHQPGWPERASELIDLAVERLVNPAGIPQSAQRPRIHGAANPGPPRRPRTFHPPGAEAVAHLAASDQPAPGELEGGPRADVMDDDVKPLVFAAAVFVLFVGIATLRRAGRVSR